MSNFKANLDAIKAVASAIDEEHPDDEQLKLDMLEGETDFNEYMNKVLYKRATVLEDIKGKKFLIDCLKKRIKSDEKKVESINGFVDMLLHVASIKNFKGLVTTVSRHAVKPKPVVTDEDLLPSKYIKIKRTVDKVAINNAIKEGAVISGVSMDNGGETLSFRN